MEDIRLVIDLLIALAAAVCGGVFAQRIGLPVIVGYVLAGMVIGPNTPGFVANDDRVLLLANVGVGFLMFTLGVEFSIADLVRVRRFALITGGLQIPITVALGTGAGMLIGWEWQASLLLGGAFAISSSIVGIKVLMGRGEIESKHGTITVGIMVVQDLSLVVMLAVLPVLTDQSDNIALALGRSMLIATLALVAVLVLGTRIAPRILAAIASTGSRELFLLTVVVIALGTAAAAHEVGLSFALGAFLAGLVVSESDFDIQVAAQMGPLRDLFATLFFVSIGMLLDPTIIADHLPTVVFLSAALVFGKLIITGGSALAAGIDHWSATRIAIVVAQIGEFSFVLAGVGLSEGILVENQYGQILTVALISILAMPILLNTAPVLSRVAARLPAVATRERIRVPEPLDERGMAGHVIICGYGRIGSELARALHAHSISYCVVDINPATIRSLREHGIRAIYGDAAEELILRKLDADKARTIAITLPDLIAARSAVREAQKIKPDINVIARVSAAHLVERIAREGAHEVVQPEFEAALEFSRQVLEWHDVDPFDATGDLAARRADVYGMAGSASPPGDEDGSTFEPNPVRELY